VSDFRESIIDNSDDYRNPGKLGEQNSGKQHIDGAIFVAFAVFSGAFAARSAATAARSAVLSLSN
jgi:hypothetical protein